MSAKRAWITSRDLRNERKRQTLISDCRCCLGRISRSFDTHLSPFLPISTHFYPFIPIYIHLYPIISLFISLYILIYLYYVIYTPYLCSNSFFVYICKHWRAKEASLEACDFWVEIISPTTHPRHPHPPTHHSYEKVRRRQTGTRGVFVTLASHAWERIKIVNNCKYPVIVTVTVIITT